MPKPPSITPDSDLERYVVKEYESGISQKVIADSLGLSVAPIRTALMRLGIIDGKTRRPRKKIDDGMTGYQRWYHKIRNDPDLRVEFNKKRYTFVLKRDYGLTREEYDELFESQDLKCLICKLPKGSGVKFSVDHCHTTGNIRGILCPNCNSMIGLAKDSPEVLEAAIEYLRLPPFKSCSAKIPSPESTQE